MSDLIQPNQPAENDCPEGFGKIQAIMPLTMIPVVQSIVSFLVSSRVSNPDKPVAFTIVASSYPIGNPEDSSDRLTLTNSGFTLARDPDEMDADELREHAHAMLSSLAQAEVSFDHDVFRMTQAWGEALARKGVKVSGVAEQHKGIQIAATLRDFYENQRQGLVSRVASGKLLVSILSDGVSCLRDFQVFGAPPSQPASHDPLNPHGASENPLEG